MSTNKIKIIPGTDRPEAFLLGKPQKSVFSVPQWYKDQNSKVDATRVERMDSEFTVKRCMPFFDAFAQDFVIRTQYDFAITYDTKRNRQFEIFTDRWRVDENIVGKDPQFHDIGTHAFEQFSNAPIPEIYDKMGALKWMNHYIINTPKNHSLMFYHPHNRFELPFYSFSGIVDAHEFPLSVNFPFLIEKDFSGIIPKGTPVIQFSVIKKDNWKIEEEEFDINYLRDNHDKFYKNKPKDGIYRDFFRYSKKKK